MDVEDDSPPKKGIDVLENASVSDEIDSKKTEKSETEDPKPRIVLTFRSEKSNTKSANMKIVSPEEKQEEVSPRRSSRTRGKWDWVCDTDTPVSPKKDRSQPVSENDESDNSHTPSKRTRRRSKDENVMANAIARKEKSYTEATPSQRLSRRIKPTAKVLANEELRIGLESMNNARLGIQNEKSPEEGVRTRRSARPAVDTEKLKVVQKSADEGEVVELDTDSQNSDMKLKHLCKLGLKAIDTEEAEDSDVKEMDEGEILEDEEIDDDSEVISKLLEADEDEADDSDDSEFLCTLDASQSARRGGRPRRSTRLCSSYGNNDSDRSSPVNDEESSSSKAPARRSSRRAAPSEEDRSHRTRRRKRVSGDEASEVEPEEESNPAGGDEGLEAACPADQTTVVATCYCEVASNIYASMDELTELIFCQAIEIVDGVRVGCSHAARKAADGSLEALVRAGPRVPYFLACSLHAKQLVNHMCCAACGLFCTQGIFYQCSKGHLFHLECGLPAPECKARAGCPHCGVTSRRWQPANTTAARVRVDMKCSNKRIFLPDQREQYTPAYLSFSVQAVREPEPPPVVPADLLPPPAQLRALCAPPPATNTSPQALCDAILNGETVEQLIPKIVSSTSINKPLKSQDGGTCLHTAARRGHLGALYLLHAAGADLDAVDNNARTPLMAAVMALLDKPEAKSEEKELKGNTEDIEDVDMPEKEKDSVKTERDDKTEDKQPKEEDMIKVIRYLVAAGCDVNYPDQPEQMTPLHVAAQHGSAAVAAALLEARAARPDVRDHGGWTPLVWAAENCHRHLVSLLLDHGADATSVDHEGNSVVHWCALAGASGPLQLLLQRAPAAIADTNKHKDTPLHVAARQGHYACVVILLARGARSDVANEAGELPIDVSAGQCQSAIALNMQMTMVMKEKLSPYRILSSDISNGRELYPIPCINEVDDEPLPSDFTYVTDHVTPEPVYVDTSLQSLQGCQCEGDCSNASCACAVLSVRPWWRAGRLLPAFPYRDPPMLFHCNATCRCNKKECSNNTVSRLAAHGSMLIRAVVYRAGGARGWGLRAAGGVPRGAPVALYCGELLPLRAADARPDDTYMFALDVKQDLLEQCSDKSQLCVDARRYGSAARFINHSCSPNLTPVRVFREARDLRLPTVTLFASEHIPPGEPLTFDYGDKFWSVKSKWMKCECGSPDCRYPAKTEETES